MPEIFPPRPAIEGLVPAAWNTLPGIFALGLLASGGSGFWNGVLSYIYQAKNLKKAEVKKKNGGAPKT